LIACAALNANSRNKPSRSAFIDLDNFDAQRLVGHTRAITLLKKVAQRISSCVRTDDTVARFGGDEFVVLLANLGTQKAKPLLCRPRR
jgi:diguanylate cyclase (GGDEF)-like protein